MKDELAEFRLSKEVKEKLKNKTILKQELSEGNRPQEILEFSNETMSKFYGAAYEIFEKQQYEAAVDAFLFLSALNPLNPQYWLGLGMSTQLCHDYESAIDAYEQAALADISSPVPYFYLAKCLFAIHDRKSALEALDLAIETADQLPEFEALKKEAILAKELILKQEGF